MGKKRDQGDNHNKTAVVAMHGGMILTASRVGIIGREGLERCMALVSYAVVHNAGGRR